MTPLKLTAPLSSLLGSSNTGPQTAQAGGNFAEILQKMVQQTTAAQGQAQSLTVAAAGGDSVPLHEVVQAISQAQITLQTLITVRDRAVEAYQEIIRMPI